MVDNDLQSAYDHGAILGMDPEAAFQEAVAQGFESSSDFNAGDIDATHFLNTSETYVVLQDWLIENGLTDEAGIDRLGVGI